MRYFFQIFLFSIGLCPVMAQQGIEKLPATINSHYDEINPLINYAGDKIFFTRVGHPGFDKTLIIDDQNVNIRWPYHTYLQQLSSIYSQLGERSNIHPTASSFNQDIWVAESINDPFDYVHHPSYPLNNALPNSACSISPDETSIMVINQFYENGSMYKGFSEVKRVGQRWTFPQQIHIYDYDNQAQEVDMCLSKDNEVMILSMQKDSRAAADLYVCQRVHAQLWSAPERLPSTINTLYAESSPYLSDNKKILFFSSDRPNGQGGSDIYVSFRRSDDWSNWSTPQLLPAPLNTSYNEAHPCFDEKNKWIYFSSDRDGSSDIFRYQYGVELNQETEEIAQTKEQKQYLTIKAISAETGDALAADVELTIDAQTMKQPLQSKGNRLLIQPEAQHISIRAESPGYLISQTASNLQRIFAKQTDAQIVLKLFPKRKNTLINTKNVYFGQGSAEILSKSFPELNRLGDLLGLNPAIHVTINGHTDNVGDKKALMELSEKRAEAVRAYLIERGIGGYRIMTKGYGDTQPINENTSELEKSANRRVEIRITRSA